MYLAKVGWFLTWEMRRIWRPWTDQAILGQILAILSMLEEPSGREIFLDDIRYIPRNMPTACVWHWCVTMSMSLMALVIPSQAPGQSYARPNVSETTVKNMQIEAEKKILPLCRRQFQVFFLKWKTNESHWRFYWPLFLRLQFTIFQHWFR